MLRPRLFQYAILWHPTEKQIKDDGAKSKLIVQITNTLGVDANAVQLMAAMDIPAEYRTQLDQVEIAIRPF